MDAIVSDISAFRYWRIPPLVRLLASGPADDALLQSIVTEEELTQLRQGCARLPLIRELRAVSPRWRAAGLQTRAVREGAAVLGVGMEEPVDVLITRREQSRRATLIRPRLWSSGIPGSGVALIADELGVLLPEYSLLQLASRASLVQTVLLATELCGSFSVYDAPACVQEVLQTLVNERRLPRLNGWSPCLDDEGQITSLWTRRPLVSRDGLLKVAEEAPCRNGRARLMEAASLMVPGAASPFEAQTGVILGFSRKRGGEGHAGFSHNRRIALSREARALARRASCYCDLYWDEGLDLECQSKLAHASGSGYLSDADRATALELMGISVLPVTYAQLTSEERVIALSRAVADKRGVAWRQPTARERELGRKLRSEVLRDWSTLLDV